MGDGCCGSSKEEKKVTYVCSVCGREETKEDTGCCGEAKSCCGQPMQKK
jgi:hypothetical protein